MVGTKAKRSEVAHSRPTLCNPVDCVHGIFQARAVEWVAISFSRGPSWPRDLTLVSRMVGRRFTIWATREVSYGRRVGVNSSWPQLLPNFSLLYLSCFLTNKNNNFIIIIIVFSNDSPPRQQYLLLVFWTWVGKCHKIKGRGRGERLRREGLYVYLQPIQVIIQQKPTQHCKAIVFQLKIKKK